jgi:hypothetical protein
MRELLSSVVDSCSNYFHAGWIISKLLGTKISLGCFERISPELKDIFSTLERLPSDEEEPRV